MNLMRAWLVLTAAVGPACGGGVDGSGGTADAAGEPPEEDERTRIPVLAIQEPSRSPKDDVRPILLGCLQDFF